MPDDYEAEKTLAPEISRGLHVLVEQGGVSLSRCCEHGTDSVYRVGSRWLLQVSEDAEAVGVAIAFCPWCGARLTNGGSAQE